MSKRIGIFAYMKKWISLFLSITLVVSLLPSFSYQTKVFANEVSGDSAKESTVDTNVTYPSKEEQDSLNVVGSVLSSAEQTSALSTNSEQIAENGELGENAMLGATNATTLPTSVDLRSWGSAKKNLVGSVKNQWPWNTCWAQSATSAAEISIARQTGNSPVNLSAYHTSWFAYTPLSSNTSELKGTEKTQAGEGSVQSSTTNPKYTKMNLGAFTTKAPSTYMQGVGVALETDFDYPEFYSYDDFEKNGGIDNSNRNKSLARLSSWRNLGAPYTKGETDSSAGSTNMTVINQMKTELNNGNAIVLGYHSTTDYPEYWNQTNYAQYSDDYMPSNHSVCIVGYDDNYAATNFNSAHRPSGNGAFIVKNSHGTGNNEYGKAGYFYLSYYDKTMNSASVYEWDVEGYTGSYIDTSLEVVDQYDYLQADEIATFNTGWYANMYTTYQKQTIHHIGTYYLNPGTELQYKIYRLKDGATSPNDVAYSLSSPDAEGTYKSDYEGYVSIKLDTPVSLKKGEKYAVMFSGNAPRSTGISAGTTTNVVINSSESFYASNPWASWSCLTSKGASETSDNFCVKSYATVKGNTSTVTFNTNGGTTMSSKTVTDGTKISKPTNPTKSGWTFSGWYYDSKFTTEVNFDEPITHDVTLYAKFTAKVNYVLNGGTNSNLNPSEYSSGKGVSTFYNASKNGYDFAGWWSANGTTSGNWGTQIKSIASTASGTQTLYAKWTLHTYSVTFVDNKGGTNPNTVKTYTIESSDISLKDATLNAYDFDGWESSITGQVITKIAKGSYGDLTLTAKWTPHPYVLTYKNADGATNNNPATYTIEEKSDITLKNATKPGYAFRGWWSKDGTADGDWGEQVTKILKKSTGDKTFYAQWSVADLTITYKNIDDAENPNPSAFTVDDGTIKLKNATKPDYDFVSWYDKSGKKVTEIPAGTTGDVVLTAKWTPHKYTITYKNCTGANNPNPATFTCETDSFQLLEPTRPGYVFNGWTDTKGNEVVYFYSGTTGNVTYVANWTTIKYSISYANVGGATNPNTTKSYTADTSTITLKNASKKGYVFLGWFSKQGQKTGDWGKQIKTIAKGSTGNVTLYAKWKLAVQTDTMWRLYNKYTGEHFYTSNESEKKSLVAVGWKDENVGWYAPTKSSSSTPVYRLYNKYVSGGDHHYTLSASERDNLVKLGWSYEGVAWYSSKSTDISAKPLYRQYNPYATTGTHNYTLSTSEGNNLIKAGWKDEGKAWYGYESIE